MVEQQIEKSGEQHIIESKDDDLINDYFTFGPPETKENLYTMQELIDLSSSEQTKKLENMNLNCLMKLVEFQLLVDRERNVSKKGNKAEMVLDAVKQAVEEVSRKKQNDLNYNPDADKSDALSSPDPSKITVNKDNSMTNFLEFEMHIDSMKKQSSTMQSNPLNKDHFGDSKTPDNIPQPSTSSENTQSNIDSLETASNISDRSDIRSQILSKTKSLQLRLNSMIQKK